LIRDAAAGSMSARGDFTIEEQTFLLNMQEFHPMNYQNPAGKLSTCVALVDVEGDGDMDVFIGNHDTDSFFIRNNLDCKRRTVEIFPAGTYGNRSAIGAKVFFYDAGHLGDRAHLLGLRVIQSGTGGGCSDEKVAHFGVHPGRMFDARVVFPSGIVRDLHNLTGGARLVVPEAGGIPAKVWTLRLRIADALNGYRSDLRIRQFIIFISALIFALSYGRRQLLWSSKVLAACAIAMFAGYLAGLGFFYVNDRAFMWWPLATSCVAGAALAAADRFRGLSHGRTASFEAMQNRLSAFGHGGPANDIINATLFCLKNIESNAASALEQPLPVGNIATDPSAQYETLREHADEMLAVVGAEVQAVLAYLRATRFSTDIAMRLRHVWNRLRVRLQRLSRGALKNEPLPAQFIDALFEAGTKLKCELYALQRRLEEHFSCDPTTIVHAVARRHLRQGRVITIVEADAALPKVRFQHDELAYIIDELIVNAITAATGRRTEIRIHCSQRLGDVIIDVCDNGPGIQQHLWNEIFNRGFTTKQSGGFGLHHARRTVDKYGARVFVHKSEAGKGTTMRLALRAIISKEVKAEEAK
jgi:signal transduction histidine kinase